MGCASCKAVSSSVRIIDTMKRIQQKKQRLTYFVFSEDLIKIDEEHKKVLVEIMKNKEDIELRQKMFGPNVKEALEYAQKCEEILGNFENYLDTYISKHFNKA